MNQNLNHRSDGQKQNGRSLAMLGWGLAVVATALLYTGAIVFARWEKQIAPPMPQPIICLMRPDNGEAGVLPNTFIACDVYLPNFGSGVETASVQNPANVKLFKIVPDANGGHGVEVEGHANTSGAGDSIVFQPMQMLDTGTKYHFMVRHVRDTSGSEFLPFDAYFTTANAASLSPFPVAFDHIQMPKTWGTTFTGLTIGPDHRLYAGSTEGVIYRYDFLPDGTLSDPVRINTVLEGNKSPDNLTGERLITGVCFDPRSTIDNPILWVTNGVHGVEHCTDWTCKVSRLSGPNLEHYQDCVIGLPRAWRDHLSFKITFSPNFFNGDHALYFNQGSSSSTGAPDNKWGLRNEHLLTAACLRLDTDAIDKYLAENHHPLNVKTEHEAGDARDVGYYSPYAADAPLTLYATGIRCGFSMLWHSNGHLYSCLNGGAAGGSAPGTPDELSQIPRRPDGKPYTGGVVPAIEHVSETQPDLFISIEKGAYYGHPNVTRGQYVMFGGNPDDGSTNYQVHSYPRGIQPDANWHRPLWCLGISLSCNGMIEYKSDTFNGALKGKILTTRYSGGKDIEVLVPSPDGNEIVESITGIDGFTQFHDPLDLVENPDTGCLYVSEYGGQKLTLLKPNNSISRLTMQETNNIPASGKMVQVGAR
jgi:glucose/arabinose dehydrogenase